MEFRSFWIPTFAATIGYFLMGGILFALLTPLKNEFAKYPAIYRDPEAIKKVFPIGIVGMFLAMGVLTLLFSMSYPGGAPWQVGARFGALIGVFFLGTFVLHNHVNLNIGWRLTLGQGIVYFLEWVVVGIVIAETYHPLITS